MPIVSLPIFRLRWWARELESEAWYQYYSLKALKELCFQLVPNEKEKSLVDVHIYRPSKTATQSGLAKTRFWLLEYEPISEKTIDPLMGWTSSSDTLGQICLKFRKKEEAIVFAKKNGLTYRLSEPEEKSVKYKSYADNFRYRQVE